MRAEIPRDVRHDLDDPRALVLALGLADKHRRHGRNVLVRCPVHDERTPSCSVHVGRDGTIAVRCHGCGWSDDALGLVAAAHRLDRRRDFIEVVTIGAELAGRWDLVDELRGNAERRPAPPPKPRPAPEPERDYPPVAEVAAMLTRPAWDDPDVHAYLTGRAIDPDRLEAASVGVTYPGVAVGAVAYALDPSTPLPTWARYQRRSWLETGHRLLVPMVDAAGVLRSVRACRIVDGETPKRLPPGGCRAGDLVMASEVGLGLLRRTWNPSGLRVAVRVAEGEPDYLTLACARSPIATAVFGVVSGSWSPELSTRFPSHALVFVETHDDAAGDRYAQEIGESLIAAGVRSITRSA